MKITRPRSRIYCSYLPEAGQGRMSTEADKLTRRAMRVREGGGGSLDSHLGRDITPQKITVPNALEPHLL